MSLRSSQHGNRYQHGRSQVKKKENNNIRQLITNTPNQVRQYKQEVYDNIKRDPFKSEVQRLINK